jgi:hypothetical protein
MRPQANVELKPTAATSSLVKRFLTAIAAT